MAEVTNPVKTQAKAPAPPLDINSLQARWGRRFRLPVELCADGQLMGIYSDTNPAVGSMAGHIGCDPKLGVGARCPTLLNCLSKHPQRLRCRLRNLLWR